MESYLLIALLVLNAVLIAVVIWMFLKYRNIDRAYRRFMHGRTAENLEEIIMDEIAR